MQIWAGVSEFVTVVETGSFTQAAAKLDVSVAQISRQVSQLEQRLNTPLLYRTTRKVSLSAEGEVYYQHCRQVLSSLHEAERALGNLKDTPQGQIRLTAPVMYGETFVQPLIHDFMRLHPAIEVRSDLTNVQLDLIDAGYDLAIRLGKLKDSTLKATPLSQRHFKVCAAPDYLTRQGTPHVLSELDHHNCLVGQHSDWRFETEGRARSVKVTGNLSCNSGYGLVDAALKGLGLVQLPNYYVDPYLEQGQLVTVLTQYSLAPETIWAVYPYNRHLSPKIRQLVDFLKLQLS